MALCTKTFLDFPEINAKLINMQILCNERTHGNLYFFSSFKMGLVAAMDQGFCVIPITKWLKHEIGDFMLNLVENYLIKLQYFKESKAKNLIDFGFMLHINQMPEVPR